MSLKITAITTVPFRLPVRREFRWASLLKPLGGFVYVQVETDGGITGLGEVNALPDWAGDHGRHGGETQDTSIAIIKKVIEPALIGLDPCRIEAAHAVMDRVLKGNNYARAAVDMALHDIWGKVTGQPIAALLGGVFRERVPIAHMIGIMPLEEGLDEAVRASQDGIRALQVKGGENRERDIALIKAIREKLGQGIFLRLDANQGYGRAKTARAILRSMDQLLDMVEQPVVDLSNLRDLVDTVAVDVIADESCWDSRDALEIAKSGGADAISIYLAKAGGIAKARRVSDIAETASLPCDVNGSLESAIGNAANLQFALASRPVSLACVIPVTAPAGSFTTEVAGCYYEDDLVDRPFPYKDGCLLPLDGPGLGIEINPRKLERYREG
jgi:muconate cycloisomerase